VTIGATRRAWVAVGAWVAIQLLITSLPGKDVPITANHPWDWLIHAGIYGILGILLARAAAASGWQGRRLVWLFVGIGLFAAADEVHQLFIPGRNGSATDWVFDTLGVATGILSGRWMMSSAAVAKWLR
jgi:VanZ family protein